MDKIDLKARWAGLYKPSAKAVVEVDVPAFNFLMVDGQGDPNTSPDYPRAVEALYAVAYTVKFALKKAAGLDHVVMPLEGLWWADDLGSFQRDNRACWKWTMMIMQPPQASARVIQAAIADVHARKRLPGLDGLRWETFHEGRCAQIMHVGPFSAEGPAVQKVHDYIAGCSALRGKHHEIYLSDVRRAAPEKWKTIIRQPMA